MTAHKSMDVEGNMGKIKCWLGFHRWTEWEYGLQALNRPHYERTQTRQCAGCGKYGFRRIFV